MIGVIGGGSWATAIVKILLDAGTKSINWWVRSEAAAMSLMHEGVNPNHLSIVKLEGDLHVSNDLNFVVAQSDCLFVAVPSAYIETVFGCLPPEALVGKRFVSLVKGALPSKPMSVSMYLQTMCGVPAEAISVVSGPSHAEEIAEEMHTVLAIASRNPRFASEVEQLLSCRYVHTLHTEDIDGVERCGLLKNVYAIAAGLCQGLGYGDNMNAVVTGAAYGEMCHLLQRFVPFEGRDMSLPCYLGDLMVTCWSRHSRNRALGIAIAQGSTVEEAFRSMGSIAEGYYSVRNLYYILQQTDSRIPLVMMVYRVLYENADPRTEVESWLSSIFDGDNAR